MKAIYIVCMIALISAITVTPAAATTWYVPDNGSIEGVVNQASAGDTVFIRSGYYHSAGGGDGVLPIDVPLTLKGEGADVVTLDFEDIPGSWIGIRLGASGTVIEGIKIVKASRGIEVGGTDCIIRNCVFNLADPDNGILIAAVNTTFMNNVVSNSLPAYGTVQMWAASCILVNNTFIDNTGPALYLYLTPNSIIARNNFSSNGDIMVYDPGEGIKWYLNNFIDTSIGNPWSGPVPAVTYWNSTEPIEYTYSGNTYTNYLGNNWGSDYTGSNAGEGIGDVPYMVPDGLGSDFRPLVAPFENYLGEAPPAPPLPSVKTATGSGTVTFDSDAGTIEDLTAVAESALPGEGKPDLMYPHGFFSFEITGLANGTTVDVTVTLPADVPEGTQYWKCIDSAWVQIPVGSNDGDNVITITLKDGGLGDADGTEDGTIVDPGGPGVTNLIYLSPDNSVSTGSPVQVDVYTYINATDKAVASQFDIEYDPSCIQDFPSFDKSDSDWVAGGGSAMCTNTASGTLHFTTNIGENPAVSGHVKVGTLTFTCNDTCCGSFLNFTGIVKYTDGSTPFQTLYPAVDSGTFLCDHPSDPIMEVTKQVWEESSSSWVDALGPLSSEWVGQDVIFKITATAGCLDLSDIVVEDVMDSSLLYNNNANPTEDSSTAHTADWSFSTILAGNSESIEFNATIDDIGMSTNTATATATVTNLGVEVQADDTATVETMPPKPDLIVSDITVNYDLCSAGVDKAFGPTDHPGYLTQENKISANITEVNGLAVTDPFDVTFEIDGTPVCTVQLPGIAAGATETVYCDDQFRPIADVTYTITVTADSLTPSGEIPEVNETNNAMAKDITAMTLGNKGNHYQDGRILTTTDSLEGTINLVYSPGDSYYLSRYYNPGWTTYEANWTPSDLPMPATDTSIKEAKLYVYYNWDKSPGSNITNYFSMDFNGNNIPVNNHYSDIKWAGHYPYGMLVYDVANVFEVTNNNTATLTNSYPGGDMTSMDGMLLVVVYNHSSEPNRIIRITEGYDMLAASTTGASYNYGVSSEEATAYASFTGSIPLDEVSSANLITVAAAASDGGDKNRLYFNGEMWNGIWNSYPATPWVRPWVSHFGAPQLGMNETDVKAYLSATDNIAGFQSHIPDGGTDGDGFKASNAFLVIQKGIKMSAEPDSEDCYNVGEQFDVLINISPFGVPIMGAQFDLHFNASVLQAETVTYGDFLMGEGSVFIGNSEIDNANGIVSFAAARQGTTFGVTTPGTFAIVHFTAMMQGETSNLDLVNVLASDNSTPVETIDVATINSTADVCLNPAPTAVAKSDFTYNNIAEKGLSKAYFNGTESNDTDPGEITYWRWWVDDGSSVVGEIAEHLFEVPMYWSGDQTGSYVPANVTLTVTDDGIPLMDGSDSMDVTVWIAGDATGDGRVNIADAVTFGMQFGADCHINGDGLHWYDNLEGDKADLNNDKRVNIGDAMLLGTCWGHTAW